LVDGECWKVMPILECKEQQQDSCFIYLTILELLLKIVWRPKFQSRWCRGCDPLAV
jgi:hypothetical protein